MKNKSTLNQRVAEAEHERTEAMLDEQRCHDALGAARVRVHQAENQLNAVVMECRHGVRVDDVVEWEQGTEACGFCGRELSCGHKRMVVRTVNARNNSVKGQLLGAGDGGTYFTICHYSPAKYHVAERAAQK